jgi:putative peptidoglycan lipid II flippase
MVKPIRLVSGFVTVGFWTLLSRILGFVRDILIAAFMGAGPVAEAFLVAFSLPNMFRRFFAEGAFNTAFVPHVLQEAGGGRGREGFRARRLLGPGGDPDRADGGRHLFMPALVLAMAAGFAGDVRLELATDFGRIAFAYILFISLAALLSGVLNATGRFAAAAAAPLLLNIILVRRSCPGRARRAPQLAIDISSVRAEGLLPRDDPDMGRAGRGARSTGARLDRRRKVGLRAVPRCRG